MIWGWPRSKHLTHLYMLYLYALLWWENKSQMISFKCIWNYQVIFCWVYNCDLLADLTAWKHKSLIYVTLLSCIVISCISSVKRVLDPPDTYIGRMCFIFIDFWKNLERIHIRQNAKTQKNSWIVWLISVADKDSHH